MAAYLPFHDQHSIQEAQINLLFPGRFDRQVIDTTRGLVQAELSEDLPRLSEVRGGSVQIDLSNPSDPTPLGTLSADVVGFQFSNIQGNGQPARVLRLTDNVLSVSIMDYESWPVASAAVERYLMPLMASLPIAQNPVIAYGLRFIDRYTFNGRPDDANAGLLFERDNPHITPNIFESGSAWHCNTGWFDHWKQDWVLHNLNIASNLMDLSSTVTIDHQSTVHLRSPRQSMDTLFAPHDSPKFMEVLSTLHDQNKEILRKMLLHEVLVKIGLAL